MQRVETAAEAAKKSGVGTLHPWSLLICGCTGAMCRTVHGNLSEPLDKQATKAAPAVGECLSVDLTTGTAQVVPDPVPIAWHLTRHTVPVQPVTVICQHYRVVRPDTLVPPRYPASPSPPPPREA